MVLVVLVMFGFVAVGLRLTDLMLLEHDSLAQRAKDQYTATADVQAARGAILDRRGRELAGNNFAESVFCNPREVAQRERTARVLAEFAQRDYLGMLERVSSDKAFVWVKRKASRDEARRVRDMKLDGVGFVPEPSRYYPRGRLASHVLGFTGIDDQALEGIELSYDKELKAIGHSVDVTRDARGRIMSDGMEYALSGNSLVLTIDEALQYITESALSSAMESSQATAATAIMMDPYTGDVLALANMPDYDPNTPGQSDVQSRRNRALTDTYEPGSTFKLVAISAALEEKLASTSEIIDASPGYIKIGKRVIKDTHSHGRLTVPEVIQTSSNVGTIRIAQRLPYDMHYRYIKAFGFGDKTGIDLPGENSGRVTPPERWSESSQASLSIGYEVSASPLQILRAYAAIANGGVLPQPHVVSRVFTPEGELKHKFAPSATPQRVLSEHTANLMREMLVHVTEEGGTATLASIDGNAVAGKTGTSRLLDPETGTYSTKRYASSFVGFAPADKPRVALIVVVFEAKGQYYGGQVAAPVFRDIMQQALAYLDVPRDDVLKDNVLLVQGRSIKRY